MNLEKIWAQVPEDYFTKGIETNILQRLWHNGKLKAVIKILSISRIKTLVDIGSADGSFIYHFSHKINLKNIVAIDPYLPPLKYGNSKYSNINFVQADAHCLPFKKLSVPYITTLETLEHVKNPKAVLIELGRILKNDGYILVEMDSGNFLFNLVWYFWKKFGKGKVWRNAHLTTFNSKILEKYFQEVNLKIRKKISFNLGMGICYLLSK